MDSAEPRTVEDRTRQWLDESMDPGIRDSPVPETMVYDDSGRPQRVTDFAFGRLHRKLKLLRWLDTFEFGSFLDLASGWDHLPYLVRERYGVPAYYSDMVHRMNLPLDGPEFGKLDHAVSLQLPRLPFKDGAFDVVLSTEVLEHLARPVEALAELMRITRKYLIVTSLEALSASRAQRFWSHHRVDARVPHIERNFFLLDEFHALLGADLVTENLLFNPHSPANLFGPRAEQEQAYAALTDRDALAAALCRSVSEPRHGDGAMGILFVKDLSGVPPRRPQPAADAEIARWLIDKSAYEERYKYLVMSLAVTYQKKIAPFPQEAFDALRSRPVASTLLTLLRCPDCRSELEPEGTDLRCRGCRRAFQSEFGVPMLYPTASSADEAAAKASLARLCGDDAARRRAVRRIMRRLRRNERPPSALRRALWWAERRLSVGPRVQEPEVGNPTSGSAA